MDFAKLAELSVGLAGFLGGLWIVLQIIKAIPKKGALERSTSAGEQGVEFWKSRIRKACEDAVHDAMIGRNEAVRQIIREELQIALGRKR